MTGIEKVNKGKEGDGVLKQRERERESARGILKNVRPRMLVFWDVTQQC